MSHYEFGNYNRENDYSLYQIGKQKKAAADAQAANKAKEAINLKFSETKQVEAGSLDALGNYGLALSGLGKKTDVSALGLSQNDQAIVGRYVTPEQQARISEDMLGFFA